MPDANTSFMKKGNWIMGVLLLTVIVFTGNELRKPLLTSTVAVDTIMRLKKGKTITFYPSFDYGYTIRIRTRDTTESLYETIGYELSIDGVKQRVRDQFPVGSVCTTIGTFSAEEGDECSIKFTHLGHKLNGKQVSLLIDVNGGGPSVGFSWQKEFRFLLHLGLWFSLAGLVTLLVMAQLKKRR